MRARVSEAFVPAAISNFFTIHYRANERDYMKIGATGGGYTLSKGVLSRAFVYDGSGKIRIIVNGDKNYQAKTTLRALRLLLRSIGNNRVDILVEQSVDVPIGFGFGASAASSLSAIYAVASALNLKLSIEELAYFAHVAEIMEETGLGTVSAIYNNCGTGIITKAGGPGRAVVEKVNAPDDIKIVTASIAPHKKDTLISSPSMRSNINRLGKEAMKIALSNRDLGSLATAGEFFTMNLGLMNDEIALLIDTAKKNGALYASQNMVGYAIHCIVRSAQVKSVMNALSSSNPSARLDLFDIGTNPPLIGKAREVAIQLSQAL